MLLVGMEICFNKTFVRRLIGRSQFSKRLITMSIRNLSEENSRRLISESTLQINSNESDSDFNEVVTRSVRDDKDYTGEKFTEDELSIHKLHREACEVR